MKTCCAAGSLGWVNVEGRDMGLHGEVKTGDLAGAAGGHPHAWTAGLPHTDPPSPREAS